MVTYLFQTSEARWDEHLIYRPSQFTMHEFLVFFFVVVAVVGWLVGGVCVRGGLVINF